MTNEQSFVWFLAAIFMYFIIYWSENSFFYKTEMKYCHKFKGDCDKCTCWSCKRKDYIKRGDKD